MHAVEQRVRGIPSRFAGGGSVTPVRVGRVIGGNTLTGSLPGIKWISTPASVATAIDPYADPALADGVGYAYLYLDGVQQFEPDTTPTRVLLYHYLTFIRYALLGGDVGEFVLLGPQVTIPGAGGNLGYGIKGF